jgi:hypothetical protein
MMAQPRHRHLHATDRSATPVVAFWKDPSGVPGAVFVSACTVFCSALLLGGSGGTFGDSIVQLLALVLIVLAATTWMRQELTGPDKLVLGLIGGIVVLAIVQLTPLPLSWWSALPGRAELLGQMRIAGVTPAWPSLSLEPEATERALLWILPAIGMFLATRWMSRRQREAMLVTLFVAVICLLMLGVSLHQMSGKDVIAATNAALAKAGPNQTTNAPIDSLEQALSVAGLFSNPNHFATLLAMTIPWVVAMGLSVWLERKEGKAGAWIPWAVILALAILGLLVGMLETRSRAALMLGGLSLAGSVALLRQMRLGRILPVSLVATALAVALLALEFASSATLSRLDASPTTDMRWQIHATTLQAARHFGPLGSGLGTFVEAYQTVSPMRDNGPEYINRAHGDYHELWLETGVPGAMLVGVFMAWFGWSSWRVWRGRKESVASLLVSRAASVSIALVLLHSYLDYPLRKTAILAVFGFACALLSPFSGSNGRSRIEARTVESDSGRVIGDHST